MNRIGQLVQQGRVCGYITPLFWQHGETKEVLLEEIEQMHANGIAGMILESRPFPDFAKEPWWDMVGFVLAEAKKRNMKVWVFDDLIYPSGFAGGAIRDHYPEYRKLFLRENHIDAVGPFPDASFLVGPWLGGDEQLVRVVVARRTDGVDAVDPDSLLDVTHRVTDGVLYWDVPDGDWRVFLFVRTRHGGEDGLKDYVNLLIPEAVRVFIDAVYEAHYAHFSEEFGKTFAGFFSDESRFGNFPSYDAVLGKVAMVLPYSDQLLDQLSASWGGDFSAMLPCLWYDAGELSHQARFTFMDVVSRLYGDNFTKQIGDWCRQRGVKLIGHVVEDNGAHTRVGYGAGHFFRALRGQDTSGLDIVYQVWPEHTSGRVTTPFGYLDADFFYWGIAKMASSEGHLDAKKHGTTVCEIFGAYGWQEGLKLMKWLTDHVCVRGVNLMIPHAFSPKDFPDPDCPPHFYARGNNPQWRYFHVWSDYANRVCHLLSGGTHVATVAVLYHAEAEWAGDYEPFEKVVKTLAQRQIDCDVVPVDTFLDPSAVAVEGDRLKIHTESFQTLVIPWSEALPAAFLEKVLDLADQGLHILFMKALPLRTSRSCSNGPELLARLKNHPRIGLSNHERLVADLRQLGAVDIQVSSVEENLRYYHYTRPGEHVYFFVNQSRKHAIDTTVTFSHSGRPIGYDALEGKFHLPRATASGERTGVRVSLEPYESTFVVFSDPEVLDVDRLERRLGGKDFSGVLSVDGKWRVSLATAGEYPKFAAYSGISGLGNVSIPNLLPTFSGTLRYEIDFDVQDVAAGKEFALDLGRVFEIADVQLNGMAVGTRICPPYRMNVTHALKEGENHLQVDVTNTLVRQYGQNHLDRAMPQEPSGLLGPVQLLSADR